MVVIGSITWDEIWIAGRRTVKMGGVPTYAGLTYIRSGIPTRGVTRVSKHDTWMMENLKREGIVPYFQKDDATTRFVNVVKGNSRRQEVRATARPISKESILAAIEGADTIHLGPLHPGDMDPDALALLRPEAFFIVLDIQGYLRQIKGKRIRPGVSPVLADALRIARIVKGDREEMAQALAFFDCDMNGLLLKFQIQEAVVTEGDKGGWVHRDRGDRVHFKGETISTPQDPTGAGDVFLAAYVIQRRFKGLEIPEAARMAVRTAACQVAGKHIRYRTLCPDPGGES